MTIWEGMTLIILWVFWMAITEKLVKQIRRYISGD